MAFIVHVSLLVARDGHLLLVREEGGLWNLPGGHLEHHEPLAVGAARELREETGLAAEPDSLIGIYTGFGDAHLINLVFHAAGKGEAAAQGEVQEVRWFEPAQALALRDAETLNPRKLKQVVRDWLAGSAIPLSAIHEDLYGSGT